MADPHEGPFSPLPHDDPHFAIVGRVACNWAILESLIDGTIANLALCGEAYMACVTAQLIGPAKRMDVGRVRGLAEPATEFKIKINGQEQRAIDALNAGSYHRNNINDPEKMEYFVPVGWAQTVPLESAVDEIGLFGNQNTVCAPKTPKWRHTIERLQIAFPKFDSA